MLVRSLLLLLCVAMLFFSPSITQYKTILFKELADLSHVFFFFFIFIYLYKKLFINRIFITLLSTIVLAFCVEYIQPFFGRSASFIDFINGVVGGLLAFVIFSKEYGVYSLILALSLSVFFPLTELYYAYESYLYRHNSFPVLGSFDSDLELKYWKPVATSNGYSKLKIKDGKLDVEGESSCGTEFLNENLDWGAYELLRIRYQSEKGATLYIRTDDENSGSDYNKRFTFKKNVISSLPSEIKIPLDSIVTFKKKKPLLLGSIKRVVVFAEGFADECFLQLELVKLE